MSSAEGAVAEPIVVGRYVLSAELARGGMATVYVGRLHGDGGFKRVVAIKRLHAQFRTDDNLSTMFLDEARVAARIRHPNVVHAVDVALHDGEMFIVMEYVEGASLSQLMRVLGKREEDVPLAVVCSVVSGLLQGLHAAHEAADEQGQPLGIVHRDVSPQNVLVGTDGVARVLDFGVAKAVGQAHVTREGEVKGKLAYMAPEHVLGQPITRTADVFAAGTILWELLTGRRLFYGGNDGEIIRRLLDSPIPPPSTLNEALTPEVDQLVLRALERDPALRFRTAAEMVTALEHAIQPATAREVGAWVRGLAGEALAARAALVARVEAEPITAPSLTTHVGDVHVGDVRSVSEPRSRRAGTLALVLGGLALVGAGWAASRLSTAKPAEAAPKAVDPVAASASSAADGVVGFSAATRPAPSASEVISAVAPSSTSTAGSGPSTSVASTGPSSGTASRPRPTVRPAASPGATKGPIYSRD